MYKFIPYWLPAEYVVPVAEYGRNVLKLVRVLKLPELP